MFFEVKKMKRGAVDQPCTIVGSDRPDENYNPSKILEEAKEISDAAEAGASVMIAEQNRIASEHETLTNHLEFLLASTGSNRTELSELAKSASATAASVRLACRGDCVEEEISFADDALRSAADARVQRCLAAKVRHIANRSSRLETEIASFRKLLQTPIPLKPANSVDRTALRAETAHFEEKATILRKKLESLKAPSHTALQKRYDECQALKEQLNVAQKRLKKFEGLPPSLAEAAQKLREAKLELDNLRFELRRCNAHSFGINF